MLVNIQTRVLGLIGESLSHSLSPLMQNHALGLIKENYVYLPFEVAADDLEAAVQGIRTLGIVGVNVTIPYKQRVIPFMDELDASARDCGAVNLIANRQGRLTGYNTDGAGFILGLKDAGFSVPEKVLLIGGGGAARSVAVELARCGSREFVILDKQPGMAASLAELLNLKAGTSAEVHVNKQSVFDRLVSGVQMIINCSPAGMYPQACNAPVNDLAAVPPGIPVCDLIYNPLETRLLKIARERGLPFINGVAMLANQGALSLEIWTGKTAPRQAMYDILIEELQRMQEMQGL